MSQLILIVEDEPKLSALIRDYLERSCFTTHAITNGLEVVEWVNENSPDLIVLDLMLPGKDGLEVCKELRGFSNVPIIMVTAKVEEIDRLLGLELGADDYVCKPFSPRELVARVKNVLRRVNPPEEKSSTNNKIPLHLNKDTYQVSHGSKKLDLTSVEFELLSVMTDSPGRIFSRDQLMDRIYADHRIVSGRTIDSHIKKLRKKLTKFESLESPSKEWIVSAYGVGYKVEFD